MSGPQSLYLAQFGLTEPPFRLSPDPRFLFLSQAHARAKAYMESTIWFTDGFVVITGEIGSGKTTLIETFLSELPKDVIVAQVNQTQLTAVEFLRVLLAQFGYSPFQMKKAELLSTLTGYLIEQHAAGRKVLLIVDEAQNLGTRVLEEIRMLSGIETTTEKVLRIVLAGQPELADKLDAPELVQLAQRVRLRFHLTALSSTDTKSYVEHRLEVAGSQGRTIFPQDGYPLIYRYTGGVPRLVNTLCDTALLAAMNAERDHVLRSDLEAAVEELQWSEFSERPLPPGSRRPGASREKPLARLKLTMDGQTVVERTLLAGRFLIGRSPDSDLCIDHPAISRHHCQIVSNDRLCIVQDLNSTNGVQVMGKRVRVHNLNDGDVLTIGAHQLLYMDERSATAETHGPDATMTGPQPVLPEDG